MMIPLEDTIEARMPVIGVPAALTEFTVRGTEVCGEFASKSTILEKSPVRAPYGLGSVLFVT